VKLSIEVVGFKKFQKGTLRGFCDIVIRELRLKVHEVALHQKNEARWAAMPSKPWLLKDGVAVRGDDGKIQYSQLFEFETREVRDAFSREVWRAVLEYDPGVVS
jgi:DNA phosphorothioation-dependent restriction protein DptG